MITSRTQLNIKVIEKSQGYMSSLRVFANMILLERVVLESRNIIR